MSVTTLPLLQPNTTSKYIAGIDYITYHCTVYPIFTFIYIEYNENYYSYARARKETEVQNMNGCEVNIDIMVE